MSLGKPVHLPFQLLAMEMWHQKRQLLNRDEEKVFRVKVVEIFLNATTITYP